MSVILVYSGIFTETSHEYHYTVSVVLVMVFIHVDSLVCLMVHSLKGTFSKYFILLLSQGIFSKFLLYVYMHDGFRSTPGVAYSISLKGIFSADVVIQ